MRASRLVGKGVCHELMPRRPWHGPWLPSTAASRSSAADVASKGSAQILCTWLQRLSSNRHVHTGHHVQTSLYGRGASPYRSDRVFTPRSVHTVGQMNACLHISVHPGRAFSTRHATVVGLAHDERTFSVHSARGTQRKSALDLPWTPRT